MALMNQKILVVGGGIAGCLAGPIIMIFSPRSAGLGCTERQTPNPV